MEQEDKWNPEAMFGPPWPSNYCRLIENTIGELSVNKAMAI